METSNDSTRLLWSAGSLAENRQERRSAYQDQRDDSVGDIPPGAREDSGQKTAVQCWAQGVRCHSAIQNSHSTVALQPVGRRDRVSGS